VTRQIKSVAVCGSGTMGAGIAALCAIPKMPQVLRAAGAWHPVP